MSRSQPQSSLGVSLFRPKFVLQRVKMVRIAKYRPTRKDHASKRRKPRSGTYSVYKLADALGGLRTPRSLYVEPASEYGILKPKTTTHAQKKELLAFTPVPSGSSLVAEPSKA